MECGVWLILALNKPSTNTFMLGMKTVAFVNLCIKKDFFYALYEQDFDQLQQPNPASMLNVKFVKLSFTFRGHVKAFSRTPVIFLISYRLLSDLD